MKNESIKVIQKNPEQWQENIAAFDLSIFMLPQILHIIEDQNKQPFFIDFESNNSVIAKTSGLIIKEQFGRGKRLFCYSPPAPKHNQTEHINNCLNALYQFAKENQIARIKILYFDQRTPTNILHINNKFRVQKMFEAVINLQDDYRQFKPGSSLRKKRNSAVKTGTSIIKSNDPEILNKLSELAENTLRRRQNKHHSEYKKLDFPHLTYDHLSKLIEMGLAKMYFTQNPDGEIHFIAYVLEINNSAYGLFNGCDDTGYQIGLPGYVLLTLSQQYQNNGFLRFNLGGVPAGSSEKKKLTTI